MGGLNEKISAGIGASVLVAATMLNAEGAETNTPVALTKEQVIKNCEGQLKSAQVSCNARLQLASIGGELTPDNLVANRSESAKKSMFEGWNSDQIDRFLRDNFGFDLKSQIVRIEEAPEPLIGIISSDFLNVRVPKGDLNLTEVNKDNLWKVFKDILQNRGEEPDLETRWEERINQILKNPELTEKVLNAFNIALKKVRDSEETEVNPYEIEKRIIVAISAIINNDVEQKDDRFNLAYAQDLHSLRVLGGSKSIKGAVKVYINDREGYIISRIDRQAVEEFNAMGVELDIETILAHNKVYRETYEKFTASGNEDTNKNFGNLSNSAQIAVLEVFVKVDWDINPDIDNPFAEFYANAQIADKERQIAEIEAQIKILEAKADTLPEDEAESIFAQLDNLIEIQIKLLDEINAINDSEIARHDQLQLASREIQKGQQETLRKQDANLRKQDANLRKQNENLRIQDEIIELIATIRHNIGGANLGKTN